MDADAKLAAFSRRRRAGGLHVVVELIDTGRHPFDKKASGFGEPDASLLRSNRTMPSSVSSALTRALTLDWLVPSA